MMNHNCGFLVLMMCQHRPSIIANVPSCVDHRESLCMWGTDRTWEIAVLSPEFRCELKTTLKK